MVGAIIRRRAVMGIMILDAKHGQIVVNSVSIVAIDMMEMHADIPSLANAANASVFG
jgi:hypothetical protein